MYKYRYVKVSCNGKCFYAHERSFLGLFKSYLKKDKQAVIYQRNLKNLDGVPYSDILFTSVKEIGNFLQERQYTTEYIEPTSLEKFLDGEE